MYMLPEVISLTLQQSIGATSLDPMLKDLVYQDLNAWVVEHSRSFEDGDVVVQLMETIASCARKLYEVDVFLSEANIDYVSLIHRESGKTHPLSIQWEKVNYGAYSGESNDNR